MTRVLVIATMLVSLLLISACGGDRRAASSPSGSGSSNSQSGQTAYDYSPNRNQPAAPTYVTTKSWVVSEDTWLCARRRDMELYGNGEVDEGTAYSRAEKGTLTPLAAGTEVEQDLDISEKDWFNVRWFKVEVKSGDAAGKRGNVDKTKLRPK